MSCPRCGGVLATELADAMVELVCGMFVIEGRHCHCDDGDEPVRANVLRGIVVELISEKGREPTKPEWRLP